MNPVGRDLICLVSRSELDSASAKLRKAKLESVINKVELNDQLSTAVRRKQGVVVPKQNN